MKDEHSGESRSMRTEVLVLLLAASWCLTVAGLLVWGIAKTKKESSRLAEQVAQSYFNKDYAFRLWGASHGGVYVPITDRTPPNPYLSHIPERDLETPSGKRLTLMNPAYMLRQIQEDFTHLFGVKARITSLKPLRPETAPDEWHKKALTSFERGAKAAKEFTHIQGEPYLRLMKPLMVDKSCLKCHAQQNYKEGDIRGGVSVSLPMTPFLTAQDGEIRTQILSHGVVLVLGLLGLGFVYTRLRRREAERDQAFKDLEDARNGLEEEARSRTADLARERDRVSEILGSIRDGFFTLDDNLIVTYFNRASERLVGRKSDEVVGKNLFDAFPEARGTVFEEHYTKALKDKQPISFETYFDARPYAGWYDVNVYPHSQGISVYFQIITERREAEEKLRESRQLLQNILEASPVGLGYLEGRKLGWANPAMLQMFGFECDEEYLGKDGRILYASDEECERVGKIIREAFAAGRNPETVATFKRKDGTFFEGLLRVTAPGSSSPLEYALAAITDITELKRAEEALRASEEAFRSVFENSHDGILLTAPDGRIFKANQAACRMQGRAEQEIRALGRDCIVDLTDRRLTQALEKRTRTGHFRGEVNHKRKDGTVFPVEVSMATFRNAEGELRSNVIFRDITERKQAEHAVLQIERLKGVAELAKGVSHNFNNILQVILGNADFALGDLESRNLPEVKQALELIIERSRFGSKVVKGLQDFTQVLPENREATVSTFDLSQTVEEAVELSRPWWKKEPGEGGTNIALTCKLSPGCVIEANKPDILQVILTLIKNAVEALTKGGELLITTSVSDDEVLLRVRDNGVGIQSEHLSSIFQPFWTTKGAQTVGMGLASAVGIVRHYGGEISVESEEGKGAAFTVRLPKTDKPIAVEPPAESTVDSSVKILVVDDEPLIVQLMEKQLASQGHIVFKAGSGEEAIKSLMETPVDQVICDLAMKGLDGLETLKQMRVKCEERGMPKPRFILVTGYPGHLTERDRLAEAGVDCILEKPLDGAKLFATIREGEH